VSKRPGRRAPRVRNVTRTQERFHESGRWVWWDHLWQDLRFAFAHAAQIAGLHGHCRLTMALGIGATTAIFSVVNATLLHALPYPQPEQLVSVQDDLVGVPAQDVGMSELSGRIFSVPAFSPTCRRRGSMTTISPAHRNLRAFAS